MTLAPVVIQPPAPATAPQWGGPPGTERVVETHTARVYLTAQHAYKIRKPVRFAFVDYTSVSARLAAAEAEVALNRDLAPGVYLAVLPLVIRAGLLALAAAGDATDEAVDHVVLMRRFADTDTLAARLTAGCVSSAQLRAVGRRIAEFHERAAPAPGGAARALARINRNSEELLERSAHSGPDAGLNPVIDGLHRMVLQQAAQLDARGARGRWRDGHGDLRAEHVVLEPDELLIVDRLEFDADLRRDDVAADLAYLLMDLEARGHLSAAAAVLDGYRDAGGDAGDDRLLACWGAYRATVAAKVAHLRADQHMPAARTLSAARLRLARRLLWRAAGADVIVVCGPPATGKSTLAADLQRVAGGAVVSSDIVRKARVGLAPTERGGPSAYTRQVTDQVYRDLGRRAADLRCHGDLVIVDATMHRAEDRASFLDALGSAAAVRWVQCTAPAGLTRGRAAARSLDASAVSDAGPAVVNALAAAWQPLEEITANDTITVRTDGRVGQALEEVERWAWSWRAAS